MQETSFFNNRRSALCTLIGLAVIIVAAEISNSAGHHRTQRLANDCIMAIFVGLALVLQPWIWRFVSTTYDNAVPATTPLPSPSQIHGELSAYYGREATIEEVAAAQSIYAHRRNEAAAQAALGVGAFLLFRDAARR